ncbi:MAG: FAD-dependent oxidoreductase [Bauldia sp.]
MLGKVHDVAVIGGGLNGVAVARDAAGRGLSVFLCEEGDLGGGAGSATQAGSSTAGSSTWRGLRFAAMREAVAEREVLLRAAPHLVRPLTFLIPHHVAAVVAGGAPPRPLRLRPRRPLVAAARRA